MARRKLPLTKVSGDAHLAVREIEQASMALGKASTPDEVNAAFNELASRRREIYTHLSRLERMAGVERNVSLRF